MGSIARLHPQGRGHAHCRRLPARLLLELPSLTPSSALAAFLEDSSLGISSKDAVALCHSGWSPNTCATGF